MIVSKRYNEYAKIGNPKNKEGIDFIGECFIGKKKEEGFVILKKLIYSSGSLYYDEAADILKDIYLKELYFIENECNINDRRFWDSSLW